MALEHQKNYLKKSWKKTRHNIFSKTCRKTIDKIYDVDAMVKYIDTAIASKVDGIITMALSPAAIGPAIDRAVDAGIPVVLVDTDAPESKRAAYVGTSNYDAGYEQRLESSEAPLDRKQTTTESRALRMQLRMSRIWRS